MSSEIVACINNDICDEDCTLKLSSKASTRNSITLIWNAVNNFKHKPTYKVQLKERLWGWITKYWGFRTEVEIKQLAPQECYNFRVGIVKPNGNSEADIIWSSTIRAITKDEHISALSLHRAILYGNMSLAKKFLSLRPSTIDCYDSNGKTALMKCARLGDTKLMSLLLFAGASINMQSISSCSTALMIACWFGHLSVARLLHENNANWFVKDSYGCTALHYAVDNSQKELINFALECRANIEERDNNGWTPLLRGVYLGSETSALSELIQKGACVNVCDVRGQTPLMQAVLTNNGDSISVIKLLLSAGAEIKVFNKYNNTALLMANAHHDYVVVEELITSLQIDKDGFENEILSKIIGNGKNCEVATVLTEPIQVIKD